MNPAVAIFVKTPGLSPIKTRLGESYGQQAAEAWHRRAAECVSNCRESVADNRLTGPSRKPKAMQHPNCGTNMPRMAQGEGGLGRRMAAVHTELVRRHGAGILIGADLPQIEAPTTCASRRCWLACRRAATYIWAQLA